MSADVPQNSNTTLDDHVDAEIAACLSEAPRSFFLFAGAGSGKTRSLVEALRYIRNKHGARLGLRSQGVAVITYTNAACDEINRRLEHAQLFQVSTIHSFAWKLIQNFNNDIRSWLRERLKQDIAELREAEAKGRSGTKASIARQAQIESKSRRLERLESIKAFTYSPTGDNREKNSLNHAEVIQICAAFLSQKPLMQRLLVSRYPFLLIDESQDTDKRLIDAFLAVEAAHRTKFCVGFFGDTMQRIYNDGKERIEREIPAQWEKPEKRLNHRCPKRIVALINRVRSQVDKHFQEARSDLPEGYVRFFIFPSNTVDKPAAEQSVRIRMADITGDPEWKDRGKCKILTLEHHMAAKRMGFEQIFEPLYAVDDFRTGLLDGTLQATRIFTQAILPLVNAQRTGDKFATAKTVREFSPLLDTSTLKSSDDPRAQLKRAMTAIESLMSLWSKGEPSCGSILENVAANSLFTIPEALVPLLAVKQNQAEPQNQTQDRLPDEIVALEKFLLAPFSQVPPYAQYISNTAPFDTHQGVKGLEFDRVMVLMDDSEARGFMFGYEKLLGAKEPSPGDLKNESEGKETSFDRTRRLFYVTCSRARRSLALVAYSENPGAIRSHLITSDWFSGDEIILPG